MLTTLAREAAFETGAVTTKMRAWSREVWRFAVWTSYWTVLVTVDDVQHPKPHPEPVLKAVEQLRADRSRALMVGDSPFEF